MVDIYLVTWIQDLTKHLQKDTIHMMMTVSLLGKIWLITLIIIILFIYVIGSCHHLSLEIFISYIFGMF